MDVCEVSAGGLRSALARGEVSAVEVLEAVLERADRVSGPINPFAVRLDERARTAAVGGRRRPRRAGPAGPLCGVPVTIKDSHYLAGVSAATGSRALKDFVPAETSAAVERLEAAGAVIFAKTTTPEFCYFGITESPVNGRTSNPWDLDRTPGGSSGGAGAAVAAGLGPLALGGDGGGSIRIPAAFCGLVGFKPTFGLVPREPCAVGWKTLVSYGPLARSVDDARLMLRALAGWHPRDRHSLGVDDLEAPVADPRALRVVVSEDLGFAPRRRRRAQRVPRRRRAARGRGRAGRRGHARAGLVGGGVVDDRDGRGAPLGGRAVRAPPCAARRGGRASSWRTAAS